MCFGFGYLPGCCESGDKKGTTACSIGKWCCVLGSDVFCISVSVHPYGVIRAHYGHGSALSGTCVMAKQSCHMVMSCIAPHLRHALRSSHDEPKEHSSGRPTTPSDNLSDGVAGYLSKHTRSCSTQPRLDSPIPRSTSDSGKLRDGQVDGSHWRSSRPMGVGGPRSDVHHTRKRRKAGLWDLPLLFGGCWCDWMMLFRYLRTRSGQHLILLKVTSCFCGCMHISAPADIASAGASSSACSVHMP